MKPRALIFLVLGAIAVFLAGVGSARFLLPAPAPSAAPAPPASTGRSVPLFPTSSGPRVVFDPDAINLLPDASLRLDLPPGFDAGDGGDH
ncbi:MAG: hypothetical protein U0359_32325 [Byssovorax sp.]